MKKQKVIEKTKLMQEKLNTEFKKISVEIEELIRKKLSLQKYINQSGQEDD